MINLYIFDYVMGKPVCAIFDQTVKFLAPFGDEEKTTELQV